MLMVLIFVIVCILFTYEGYMPSSALTNPSPSLALTLITILPQINVHVPIGVTTVLGMKYVFFMILKVLNVSIRLFGDLSDYLSYSVIPYAFADNDQLTVLNAFFCC